jgi:adenylate cyclase
MDTTDEMPTATSRRRHSLAIALLPLAIAAFSGSWPLPAALASSPRRVRPAGEPSIATLAFVNLSDDPTMENLSDGLTLELIAELSKIPALFAIVDDSVVGYRLRPAKLDDVNRDLGARYVLHGTIRKTGNRIRVAVQLVDARTGRSVWKGRYGRDFEDAFSKQDEITRNIAMDVKAEIREAEYERVRHIPTESLNAYDLFLRGMDLLWRKMPPMPIVAPPEPPDPEARRLFERAVKLDPNFATAYAALGFVAIAEAVSQRSEVPQDFWKQWQEIAELTGKALSADESDAMAHALNVWGSLAVEITERKRAVSEGRSPNPGDWGPERAFAETERAIALDPTNADIRMLATSFLLSLGRPNEALAEAEKAMLLNPRRPPWYLTELGIAYRSVGRDPEAIDAHRKALLEDPALVLSHLELAELYGALGREDEARTEWREARRLRPELPSDFLVLQVPADARRKMPTPPEPGAQFFRVQ